MNIQDRIKSLDALLSEASTLSPAELQEQGLADLILDDDFVCEV